MNAFLNETQLWYGDICDKTIIIIRKKKHFNSNTHIHKEKYGIVVKEYEIIKPKNFKIVYLKMLSKIL